MLNKKKLETILKIILSDDLPIEGVEWQTQESTEKNILFYRLPEGAESEEVFRKRVATAQYAYLVINRHLTNPPPRTIQLEEKRWKKAQKEICDELYPLPSLKLIGVTGTNGKTTTTDLVLQIAANVGVKGMSIGTLGVRSAGKTLEEFGLTSPSYIDLRKFIHRHGQDCEFCVLEVSSHALHQERFYEMSFDFAAWTSFSQDHLDYHLTMDDYFESKLRLLDMTKTKTMIVPEGQTELRKKIEARGKKILPVPLVDASNLPLFLRSKFNQENLSLAHFIIMSLYPSFMPPDLSNLVAPEGRFYIRKKGESYIVVDFAHTPDALENICRSIRESFPLMSLRVLFGCGGDRDRGKRPKMAKVVLNHADRLYLTSDNPRFEDPERIIQDILKGNENEKIQVIVDRKTAVAKAFEELKDGVVLLLAGKGHENTISVKGKKIHYSDIEEVEKFLAGKQQ
jgi:UDP-N-acetylmuramoyl-L-alanyl-D-glutamate--2,6-diaminopimelate ligase